MAPHNRKREKESLIYCNRTQPFDSSKTPETAAFQNAGRSFKDHFSATEIIDRNRTTQPATLLHILRDFSNPSVKVILFTDSNRHLSVLLSGRSKGLGCLISFCCKFNSKFTGSSTFIFIHIKGLGLRKL